MCINKVKILLLDSSHIKLICRNLCSMMNNILAIVYPEWSHENTHMIMVSYIYNKSKFEYHNSFDH